MSGVHKNPTISFRISDYERREIEARIKASGMMKKTFFTRCCIYGRIKVNPFVKTIFLPFLSWIPEGNIPILSLP